MKIKMGMPSELKALIRNRKLQTLKHGVLYKRSKVDARTKHLLVVPPSHRQRAMEGCHNQVWAFRSRQGFRFAKGQVLLACYVCCCCIIYQQLPQDV